MEFSRESQEPHLCLQKFILAEDLYYMLSRFTFFGKEIERGFWWKTYTGVSIGRFQFEFSDGLPNTFLYTYPVVFKHRKRVIHEFHVNIEHLNDLEKNKNNLGIVFIYSTS